MVASLFGASTLPVLHFHAPPQAIFSDHIPLNFAVTFSVSQPITVTVRLLTADYRPHHLLTTSHQSVLHISESTTHRFDDLYVKKPTEISEENLVQTVEKDHWHLSDDQIAHERCAEEEVIRIMVEAATASASSVIVSDIIRRDNTPLEIVDVSQNIVGNTKEKVWLLLNKSVVDINISVDIGNRMLPAEQLAIHDKLVIFSLPMLVVSEKADDASSSTNHYKIFLRHGMQQLELPVQLQIRDTALKSSNTLETANKEAHVASLFEFAAGGEPKALVKLLVPLLGITDHDGCNALHVAARNKQNFALKTLLSVLSEYSNDNERQSILDATNARGQTALHCAVRAGDPDCVHYLIGAGAKKYIMDNNSDTVAHYLGEVYNDAIYKEILETKHSGEIESENGVTERSILSIKNCHGYTPTHVAVKKLKLGLLEALIEAGAPLDIQDNDGDTPLLTALNMDDVDAASLLLQHNCGINTASKNGDTPLKIACKKKNLVMIGRLLDAGCTMNSLGADDERPEEAFDEEVQRILNGERVDTYVRDNTDTYVGDNTDEDEQELRELQSEESESTATSIDVASNYQLQTLKDDVSCLDYLTRLRLSKILDVEDKWTILADHLGCGHMVEFIRVCLDESSSPTMMLLDQYEQVPNAHLSTVAQSLEDMGELLGVRLIQTGSEHYG
ncbi:unnamed protein product [Thelazia callipaeda]|uniref:ANK_REP_REGION domain-containing protein n=1 Tax=Thelazia callipaeda TaxID=103827 RepID=A0A0N5CV78_THECL|nr:unnamed protein product [Thelazia callipaeda]